MSSMKAEPWVIGVAGVLLASIPASAQESTLTETPGILQRPDTSKFAFASTFQGENALRTGEWVLSEDEKYAGQESYVRVEPCSLNGTIFAADKGMFLAEPNKYYGLGAALEKPFNNKGKDLVMQYEVQMRNGANCGGAYVKMLTGDSSADLKELKDDTLYSIMFGADKCTTHTNKVHFIFQHQHPMTKTWSEKHCTKAPKIKDDKGFHVYTLHVKSDNAFDIYVDTKLEASGSLFEDFDPEVNPPKMINDPDDKQPEDWVTKPKIPDPEASKPEAWDEDAPRKIIDETAEMPEGWLEDEPEFIPDVTSEKPGDWDEEEDGEWEPVTIPNPACSQAVGCGKWTKPMISNSAYKGKWKAPMIDNPDYKGRWHPQKIANPDFFEDLQPSNMAPITGLAVEIWTVDGGIWMDNFVVGDDINYALKLAEQTWRPKFEAYEAKVAAERKVADSMKIKKKQKSESSRSALVSATQALINKTRPYLPSSAAPALDVAANNPVACMVTFMVGAIGFLFMARRKRQPRSGAGLGHRGAAHPSSNTPSPVTSDTREVKEVDDDEDSAMGDEKKDVQSTESEREDEKVK